VNVKYSKHNINKCSSVFVYNTIMVLGGDVLVWCSLYGFYCLQMSTWSPTTGLQRDFAKVWASWRQCPGY